MTAEVAAERAPAQTAPAAARPSTFSSLGSHNYKLFFTGQVVSQAGSWMQNLGIGWATLQLSHSGLVLGIVTAARFVPLVLLGPWGGLVADRSDSRRLLTITQTCMGVLSLLLAICTAAGWLGLPLLILVVTALGLVNVADNPSRQSLIPQLVDEKNLANAIALNSVAMNLSRVMGPSIGGVVIATLGVAPCFFINAASFAAVIFSLLAMRSSEIRPRERERRAKGQIRAGLRYVAMNPGLMRPMILVTVTGILTWEFPVSLPLMTTSTFHADARAYGIATACMGAGSVLGGLVAARRTSLNVRMLAISCALWGSAIVLAGLAPALAVLFVLLAVVGSGSITFNSMAKTLLQMQAAPQYRGRVMSLWSIAWQGGTVIGAPVIGGAAALFGARWSLLIGGIAAVLSGLGVLLFAGRDHPD